LTASFGHRLNLNGIHGAIFGGESGSGARPMLQEWVTDIRDQCLRAKVPIFFKQWGGVQKTRSGRTRRTNLGRDAD